MELLKAGNGLAYLRLEEEDCRRLAQACYGAALDIGGSEVPARMYGLPEDKPASNPAVLAASLIFSAMGTAFDAMLQAARNDPISSIGTSWYADGALCGVCGHQKPTRTAKIGGA